MPFDARTLITINLAVQIALLVMVLTGVYLSVIKGDVKRHCLLMRIAVPVQIVATIVVMSPSLPNFTSAISLNPLFSIEGLVHHSLGLVVILDWIYINLALTGIIRARGGVLWPMRIAAVSWLVAFALGIHMYFVLWV